MAKQGRICSCHLSDHQNWFLARPLLEDGGTTAEYLNMAMEVRLLILIERAVLVCHQGGGKGNRGRISR